MQLLACLTVQKKNRYSRWRRFDNTRSDGREEYVIRIPGFTGELTKFMTEREVLEFCAKNNATVRKMLGRGDKTMARTIGNILTRE